MIPGAPAADAPVAGPAGDWLLGYLGGDFTLLGFDAAVGPFGVAALAREPIPCKVVQVGGRPTAGATTIEDVQGLAAERYEARPGTVYLLRPDQHVCARWRAVRPAGRARGDRARDVRRYDERPPRSLCAASPHPAARDQPSAVLRPSAWCSLPPEGALSALRAAGRALRRIAMATLNTEANIAAPDDFYERLIATHRGLSDGRARSSTPSSSCCSPITSATLPCSRRRWRRRATASGAAAGRRSADEPRTAHRARLTPR